MCRLFGFRSVIPSHVHRSLVNADNALANQSVRHPDGWGVCYYVDGTPHLTRSASHALSDALFHRVSGVVSSETVLAHVRKATQGERTVLNCHPFQHGRWVFAHNGDIPQFSTSWRDKMLGEVAPRLRRYILGETDSEVLFFLFLTRLEQQGPLNRPQTVEVAAACLRDTMGRVRELCGDSAGAASLLTCIATDGATMVGHHGGKELFWSSFKTRCADRDQCPNLSPECEAATQTGFVNHMILSSEPILGENVWHEMQPREVVGVDWRMKLHLVAPAEA